MFNCRIEAGDKVLVSRVQVGPVAGRSDPNEARLVQTHNRRQGWGFRFSRSFCGVRIVIIAVCCTFGLVDEFVVPFRAVQTKLLAIDFLSQFLQGMLINICFEKCLNSFACGIFDVSKK